MFQGILKQIFDPVFLIYDKTVISLRQILTNEYCLWFDFGMNAYSHGILSQDLRRQSKGKIVNWLNWDVSHEDTFMA
jgi:hypothetical protein